jgi:hypothetical protein
LSRGFGPASYPTEPLGSYHVLPTTTWMDPPSTGDLRRWGARRVEEGRGTEQPYGRTTRFPSPLIKPDVPISGIRLSDRLHQRLTDAAPGEHRAVATRPNPRTQPSPRIW